MRSNGRLSTNSMATSLALSRRLGLKSLDSMDPLRSMASTMSMPSRVMFSTVEAVCGLNNATLSAARPRVRSPFGTSSHVHTPQSRRVQAGVSALCRAEGDHHIPCVA